VCVEVDGDIWQYHMSLSLVERLAQGLGKEGGHRLVHVSITPPEKQITNSSRNTTQCVYSSAQYDFNTDFYSATLAPVRFGSKGYV
jgi:hypothetical protein